jgi:ABC-type dipeptide/oligopeptide/nickel transport system permease component
MNKRIFLLVIFLLITVTFISAKFYFNTKKKLLNEYNHYLKLEKKIKEVYNLKHKYKLNKNRLNSLKRYCNVLNKEEKYLLKCKNLDEKKFNLVQNLVFRGNFKIKSFDIDKNKTISLFVEIIK